MQKIDRKLRVFLCHTSQDKSIVRVLYHWLNSTGWIDPWLDEEKLLPGQDWNLEIEKAVELTDAVIVCLSNNSVSKEGYVQKELQIALDKACMKPEGTIFIIPLRLEPCHPPHRLMHWQYVDYFEHETREIARRRILQSLMERAVSIGIDTDEKASKFFVQDGHQIYTFGGMEFLKITKGEFLMGSTEGNPYANKDEKKQQTFTIPYDYWIARYPVTNLQFTHFVRSAGSFFRLPEGEPKHPVIQINWREAQAFIKRLNESIIDGLPTGYVFSLPTEAEWEKAARGNDGREWPWGNKFDNKLCNSMESGIGQTTPVGLYIPNGDSPFGVADMAGNVWEWTCSQYRPYPYFFHEARDSFINSENMVLRGGSYFDNRGDVRCASRQMGRFGINVGAGFRVAIVLKTI